MLARTVTKFDRCASTPSHRQQSTRGRERHHRGPDRRRADQVRDGQGGRHPGGRPVPVYPDALSRQLRLRAAHALGRRRSDRRAGRQHAADRARRGDQCAPGRRAKMQDEAGGDEKVLAVPRRSSPGATSTSTNTPTCRRSRCSRSSTSSSTTRTSSRANG